MAAPDRTRTDARRTPAPHRQAAPEAVDEPALIEAADALLRTNGGALLLTGTAPALLSRRALSDDQVDHLLRLAVHGERARSRDGDDFIVLEPLRRGSVASLLALRYPDHSSLSAAEEHALGLFLELAGGNVPARHAENRRLLAVSAIQESISAQSPLVEVFRAMYERAAEEIDTPTFIAATYDAAAQSVHYSYIMQDGIERSPAEFPPRGIAGVLLEAIRTAKPRIVDDITALPDPNRSAVLGDGPRPVRSLVVVPMVRRHEVIGVIEAQSYRPAAFTAEDSYLLAALANQAAVALESAHLLEESRLQVARLTLLNQVAVATTHAEEIATACRQALDLVLQAMPGIEMANVWLVDYDRPSLSRLASTGFSEEERSRYQRVPLDDSRTTSQTVRNGRSQVIQVQAGAELPSETRPFVARNHIATLIHVPMRSGPRIAGVLTLASSQRREVDPQAIEFLETLANQLGAQLEAVVLHERHEAERRRLHAIIERLPEAIAIADAEGQITNANHVAQELWGQPLQPVSLQQFPQVYGLHQPDGRPLAWQETPLARSLLQGEVSTGTELLIRRADGSEVPILSNCAPIHDSQGKVSGSVEVFQDISRLKEIDRLKDSFINTVSHELRTPTTTLRGGALTLLRRGDHLDEATKRQLLRDMSDEGERLHMLVEDLLTLTRAQAGMQLTTEPVIPHRFVNHMLLELGGRVGDHTLTVDVPSELPMVEADLFCLEQIFRNLLENAVKFSPRGQRIEIAAEAGDGAVIFSILDRGSGIPAADTDRVFEPFYRSDEVINAGAQGAGLGLAVCKRLVEMQGGRIWAESRAGGGTVFRFSVPSVGDLSEEEDEET